MPLGIHSPPLQFDPVQYLWQYGSELRFRHLKPGSAITEYQATPSNGSPLSYSIAHSVQVPNPSDLLKGI